jgi:hypothetical protein
VDKRRGCRTKLRRSLPSLIYGSPFFVRFDEERGEVNEERGEPNEERAEPDEERGKAAQERERAGWNGLQRRFTRIW